MTTTAHPTRSTAGRTATETAPGRSSSAAARRAYARRARRERTWSEYELTRVGRPVRAALRRVPFVLVLIAMLGGALAGVLVLDTSTEKMGIETSRAKVSSTALRLQIEQVKQDVAALDGTAQIARRADELGLVQAHNPAIIVIDAAGAATIIGEPKPAGK